MIKEKLIERARKHHKELEPEVDNLRKLRIIIEDYIKGKIMGIKIVMLKELSKELEHIIASYNETKEEIEEQ